MVGREASAITATTKKVSSRPATTAHKRVFVQAGLESDAGSSAGASDGLVEGSQLPP